jgi:hypothetical protein
MNARETAWRIFATELNSSTLEIKATEEKTPSYIVTPLGAKVNRVLIAGVLTECSNISSVENDPIWKGRIQDVSGSFFFNIGKFQPEASAAIADLEAPCFVAAVGRVRSYTADDQRVYITVRPEHIIRISEEARNEWILETAKSTWKRLTNIKKVLGMGDATEQDLIKAGMSPTEAFGITYALDNSDRVPDSALYLKTIQAALRIILPDKDIDLGFPEDLSDEPDEIELPDEDGPSGNNSAQIEDVILNLLDELDTDGKGAPREELERRAEAEGISSIELEEVSNSLMDKGLVYEPNLRYLKRI